jgi:hypothetical protein
MVNIWKIAMAISRLNKTMLAVVFGLQNRGKYNVIKKNIEKNKSDFDKN